MLLYATRVRTRVPLENVNFRLDEDELDQLRSEADDAGYGSLSAYLRDIIHHRDDMRPVVQDRLDEHEARIKTLEAVVSGLLDDSENE